MLGKEAEADGRGAVDTGQQRAVGLGGAVRAEELFPSSWMCTHTDYEDVHSLLAAVEREDVDPNADRERRARLDEHVAATTTFDSWEELLAEALDRYAED